MEDDDGCLVDDDDATMRIPFQQRKRFQISRLLSHVAKVGLSVYAVDILCVGLSTMGFDLSKNGKYMQNLHIPRGHCNSFWHSKSSHYAVFITLKIQKRWVQGLKFLIDLLMVFLLLW